MISIYKQKMFPNRLCRAPTLFRECPVESSCQSSNKSPKIVNYDELSSHTVLWQLLCKKCLSLQKCWVTKHKLDTLICPWSDVLYSNCLFNTTTNWWHIHHHSHCLSLHSVKLCEFCDHCVHLCFRGVEVNISSVSRGMCCDVILFLHRFVSCLLVKFVTVTTELICFSQSAEAILFSFSMKHDGLLCLGNKKRHEWKQTVPDTTCTAIMCWCLKGLKSLTRVWSHRSLYQRFCLWEYTTATDKLVLHLDHSSLASDWTVNR